MVIYVTHHYKMSHMSLLEYFELCVSHYSMFNYTFQMTHHLLNST